MSWTTANAQKLPLAKYWVSEVCTIAMKLQKFSLTLEPANITLLQEISSYFGIADALDVDVSLDVMMRPVGKDVNWEGARTTLDYRNLREWKDGSNRKNKLLHYFPTFTFNWSWILIRYWRPFVTSALLSWMLVHTEPLRMRTNVVYKFRVIRRLYRRKVEWLFKTMLLIFQFL